MNIKNAIFVIAVLLGSMCLFSETASASNVREGIEGLSDVRTDKMRVHPEDSTMHILCPELFVKPRFPVIAQRNSSYSERWHFTPQDTTKQEFLIIAENSICDTLINELRTYSEDVHAIYGYGIYLVSLENATAAQLRSLIISYQNNLCGVLLVGDVGEAWYEIDQDPLTGYYEKWPCDLYFMDLDGTWTDSDNNGIFDGHSGNQNPDIFLARLSTVGLSGLGSESALIKRQLSKSHDFWWKSSFQSPETALNYVGQNINFCPNGQYLYPVFASHNYVDIRYNNYPISSTDFLTRLNSGNYGLTHLVCHSTTTSHEITRAGQNVQTSDVINNTSGNYAIILFCCYACYWKSSQPYYLGGAHLFNLGKTMAVIGTTKESALGGASFLYSAFPAQNLGNAYLHWWTEINGETHTPDNVCDHYGITLLGDPTINFRHNVSNYCVNDLQLTSFPQDNESNLVLFRAANSITVSQNFIIPANVHVVFDAPTVTINPEFTCPIGASFEIRNEGCEL